MMSPSTAPKSKPPIPVWVVFACIFPSASCRKFLDRQNYFEPATTTTTNHNRASTCGSHFPRYFGFNEHATRKHKFTIGAFGAKIYHSLSPQNSVSRTLGEHPISPLKVIDRQCCPRKPVMTCSSSCHLPALGQLPRCIQSCIPKARPERRAVIAG